MADFGACYPCFKPDNADTGIIFGRLTTANLTVNLATGELYADDTLAEQVSEFASGTLAVETDDMTDYNASIIYGAKVKEGAVYYNTNDSPPRGCLAYYKSLMRKGVKFYKAIFYPRAKAALGNDNAQTKGNNITFTPTATTFTIMADDNKDWRITETFNTPEAAIAWCAEKCGIKKVHRVNVSVQGAGTGEGVTPVGTTFVADGETFKLTLDGASGVTAAYDNGAEKTTTAQTGTYTLTNVQENHDIVVVF